MVVCNRVLQVLQERFAKFVSETNSKGQQRLEQVNKLVNEMIKCGHSDAATIAEWKDGLNESWADLLELMETRTQMLAASQQLHRFFTDCREVQLTQTRPFLVDIHFGTGCNPGIRLSCVVGAGSDCREDEAASRTPVLPGQHHERSNPAESHALL